MVMNTTINQKRDEKIINILNDNPGGLNVVELAETLSITPQTMAKYSDVLASQKKIYRRLVGQSKVHYHLKWAKKLKFIK